MKRWSSLVIGGIVVAIVAMMPFSLGWNSKREYREAALALSLGLNSIQKQISASLASLR